MMMMKMMRMLKMMMKRILENPKDFHSCLEQNQLTQPVMPQKPGQCWSAELQQFVSSSHGWRQAAASSPDQKC